MDIVDKLIKRWNNANWIAYKVEEKIACEEFDTVMRLLDTLQKIIRRTKQDIRKHFGERLKCVKR